ncbi:hypothetical protein B0H15DRAFT_118949 [Mycena belliarum]|uniref:Uncharacterized protein n=1 Tax=Mycena belliarum TaxID=1033014 RepID=A0AAD6XL51_9AGAR|nr:hypothetical protein B0H15DRAFT_118949 [Mycena belliae]
MTSSSATVDSRPSLNLRSDAVRLCIALQSQLNSTFLRAATDLLSCAELPAADFRRHSRKIIRLIETARDSLEASGISLYLFTSCRQSKCLYKDIYFDILRMLHARRGDVEVALQARSSSLLIRLSSNFVGRDAGVAAQVAPKRIRQLPERIRQALAMGITTCTPHPPASPPPAGNNDMLPPDAFPPTVVLPARHRKRSRREPFLVPASPPRKRARRVHEQENQVPAPAAASITYVYKSPPLTKRFGIFCTSKTSMHHPRSVRAY